MAVIASYVKTWAQLARVTGMWLSEMFPIGARDAEEWRIADDHTGTLDPAGPPTILFSMKRALREIALVLVWASSDDSVSSPGNHRCA